MKKYINFIIRGILLSIVVTSTSNTLQAVEEPKKAPIDLTKVNIPVIIERVQSFGIDLGKRISKKPKQFSFKKPIVFAKNLSNFISSTIHRIPYAALGLQTEDFATLNEGEQDAVVAEIQKNLPTSIDTVQWMINHGGFNKLGFMITNGFGYAHRYGLIPVELIPFYEELKNFVDKNPNGIKKIGAAIHYLLKKINHELNQLQKRLGIKQPPAFYRSMVKISLTTIDGDIQKLIKVMVPVIIKNPVDVGKLAKKLIKAPLNQIDLMEVQLKFYSHLFQKGFITQTNYLELLKEASKKLK